MPGLFPDATQPTESGISQPDLIGSPGNVTGIAAGPTTPGNPPALQIATNPNSPQKLLQQAWRPESFLDFHIAMGVSMERSGVHILQGGGGGKVPASKATGGNGNGAATAAAGGAGLMTAPPQFSQAEVDRAAQASRALDQAIKIAHQNDALLQNQIASTQFGSTLVTGGVALAIPTGLIAVHEATGSISLGATAHNFWVSIDASQTPGAIDIHVWQPTSNVDNTPIACTTAVTVRWSVTGSIS